jgi:lipopolysaccharide export system protein LptC
MSEPGSHSVSAAVSRAREANATAAMRNSRFVGRMRRVLPTAAAAILGIVFVYAVFPSKSDRVSLSYHKTSVVVGDMAMKRPRLSGTDTKGNPYVIAAEAAYQQGKNTHKLALEKVAADLQYDGGKRAHATARRGYVDLDAGMLTLGGGIAFATDDGYELHTESAIADLKKNVIESKTRVSGRGPIGSVAADRIRIDHNAKRVAMHGNVKIVMIPRKVKR